MDCVFKAREHIDIVWRIAEQLEVTGTHKNRFISAMFFASINHCDAIQVLTKQRNFASSFALLRPLLENTFRAVWLHNCASIEQSQKAMIKGKWPSAWDAINSIEELSGCPKLLSKIWSDMRNHMHDFTHGGSELAYRHFGEDNVITPNVDDSEVLRLIQIVVLVSSYVLSQHIELSENEKAIRLLERLVDQSTSWCFTTGCG
ncbi:DUF5677 domain-containing protein [Vibrio profundum]|uniref:DUF6988 family protein n=1 Tax=Vibrio profundum TaxID=2910247 RepID=UPI003D13F4DA